MNKHIEKEKFLFSSLCPKTNYIRNDFSYYYLISEFIITNKKYFVG